LNKLIVKKAAVLGAGVMGAQIAAHLANANVPVVLFDLPAKDGDKNGIVKKALDGLKKLDPAPLANKGKLQFIDAANYEENLPLLAECDLVIEAIAERMDWKNDLYAKIAPFLAANAVIASNTSGLSINTLAEGLPVDVRPRFCGIHFFNPPRYMHLVEIIGTEKYRCRHAGCAGNLADFAPGQGRDSGAGYAELCRQPDWRVFHSRRHAPHRRLRPRFR
jgi:3-hydroxyacyl-CoA dehydrogenase